MKMMQVLLTIALATLLAAGCGFKKSTTTTWHNDSAGKPDRKVVEEKTDAAYKWEAATKICAGQLGMYVDDEGNVKTKGGAGVNVEIPQKDLPPIKLSVNMPKDSAVVDKEKDALIGCVAQMTNTTARAAIAALRDFGIKTLDTVGNVATSGVGTVIACWAVGCGGKGTKVDARDGSHVELYTDSPRNQEGQQGVVKRDGSPRLEQSQDKSLRPSGEGASANGHNQ